MEPLLPGDPRHVGGHRLLGRLGAGGMGVVYLGRSPGGRLVAVKVMRAHVGRDAHFRARFRREVIAARRVTGTYTAPLLDADPDAATPWLVMEYLPGLTLRAAVETYGPLPSRALRLLAAALAEAVADIHRAGLTHRDLKPANIMLTASGPRVIDFGIARPDGEDPITQHGALLGTVGFMSPEQASGDAAGPAGDVFALGAVLAFTATGREPFTGADRAATMQRVRQARPDLAGIADRGVRPLIVSCLRRRPERRPTASALLDRLGEPEASVQGTGWLPAPLAQEIDRRSVRTAPAPVPYHPGAVTPRAPVPVPGSTVGPTEASVDAGPEPPAVRRRTLLVPLAVAGVAAGVAVPVARRWGSRDERPTPQGPPSPQGPPAPPAGAPRPARTPRHPVATRRWRTRVFHGRASARLYRVGTAVVAADGAHRAGSIDPRGGRVLWTRASYQRTFGDAVSTGPDTVYLFDDRPRESTEPYVLRALHPVTRAVRWTRRMPFFASGTVATDAVVCVSVAGEVRALAAADGRHRWAARSTGASLAAGAGLVVAVDEGALGAWDARSGRARWRRELPESAGHSLISDGLVVTRDVLGTLYALRAEDGSTAWRHPVDYRSSVRHAGGGLVYVGEVDGRVRALRARTGTQAWSRRLGRPTRMLAESDTLHLAGGLLWAQGPEQTVYALDASDGRVVWTYGAWTAPGSQSIVGSQAVAVAGLVLLSTPDGYVEAVEPPE
ncbi:serine/threonine-protein kinase [Streptomyces youssoufiensis]